MLALTTLNTVLLLAIYVIVVVGVRREWFRGPRGYDGPPGPVGEVGFCFRGRDCEATSNPRD